MRSGGDSADRYLLLDDHALVGQCSVDHYRASGPGGQKRNKTSSAVRLRHHPSGLLVIAEESRSQHNNKARAVHRLRVELALRVLPPLDERCRPPVGSWQHPAAAGRLEISTRNRAYAGVVA